MPDNNMLLSQFFQEALDTLAQAEEVILRLERQGTNEEDVHSLFRLFHTLKGNSHMVGEEEIGNLTHDLESELESVRKGKKALSDKLLQTSLEVVDLLNAVCQEESSERYAAKIREMRSRLEREGKAGESGSSGSAGSAASAKTAQQNSTAQSKVKLDSASGPVPETWRYADTDPAVIPDLKSGAAALTGRTEASFPEWSAVLRELFNVEDLLSQLEKGDGDPFDLLMDMGMAVIDLRSETEGRSLAVSRLAVYIEKFVTTATREQIPYNNISYELLQVLLHDLKKQIFETLYIGGALGYKKIVSMEELIRLEGVLKEQDQGMLWIIELDFSSANPRRSNEFFTRLMELKYHSGLSLVFISPHSSYYQKATSLLNEALEGFPRLAGNVEEGIKMYIRSEE